MFLNADSTNGLFFTDDLNRAGKLWSIEVLHYGCVTETGVSYELEKLNELGQLLARLEDFTQWWEKKVSDLIEEHDEAMLAAYGADLPE